VLVEKPTRDAPPRDAEDRQLSKSRTSATLFDAGYLRSHPGRRKVQELIDAGELGVGLLVYGNRRTWNRADERERALVARRPTISSFVILYLLDEEPARAIATRASFLTEGVRTSGLLLSRVSRAASREHASVVARPAQDAEDTVAAERRMVVFDDMELERKVTGYEKAAVGDGSGAESSTASGRRARAELHPVRSRPTEPLRSNARSLK